VASNVSPTGSPIVADTAGLSRLARNLRAASPEAWKACRLAMRAAAAPVMSEAQARAGWSTRIPGSMRIRPRAGTVKIVAGGPAAPDAAPYEHHGLPGKFRHPLFGNRDYWYDQTARPFLGPAAEAAKGEVSEKLLAAVTEAVMRAIEGGQA